MERRHLRLRVRRLDDHGADDALRRATPAERMLMVWELTQDAWSFYRPKDAESRLPRHVVRVVRGGR